MDMTYFYSEIEKIRSERKINFYDILEDIIIEFIDSGNLLEVIKKYKSDLDINENIFYLDLDEIKNYKRLNEVIHPKVINCFFKYEFQYKDFYITYKEYHHTRKKEFLVIFEW